MANAAQRSARLVIASNRGPVELRTGRDGVVAEHRGAGGLVAVLGPALAHHGGVWVAAALTKEDRQAAAAESARGRLRTVEIAEGPIQFRTLVFEPQQFDRYYRAISIELLWFLHHHLFDLARAPLFDRTMRADWRYYKQVNALFAAACADEVAPQGTVLVQDHQLSLTPRLLRGLRPDVAVAHYTMVPWAAPDQFAMLPKDIRVDLVNGLLGADMLAFLVPRWSDAFLQCCADLGHRVDATGGAVDDSEGRPVAVRSFAVGVDADSLRDRAGAPDVTAHKQSLLNLAARRRLVVRIDRMDPAKNVLRGIAAFDELLQRHSEFRDRVVHFILAYLSREDVATYRAYGEDVRAAVDAVNRRHGTKRWQPVILETGNDFGRGLAAQAVADVLVVNPLRDGMNLVAKEGPIVAEGDLALVLSRGAGAADDLGEASLLVDPLDVGALAEAMAQALIMPRSERARRLKVLRERAVAMPPRRWLSSSLEELRKVREGRSPS